MSGGLTSRPVVSACGPTVRRGPVALAGWVALCVGVAGVAGSAGGSQRLWVLLILAPVIEEIVFRAGVQETLLRRAFEPVWANALTALLFALAHAGLRGPWLGVAVLLPALLLGHLYQRRRRLAPCVLLHAGMNALWLVWAAAAWPEPGPL